MLRISVGKKRGKVTKKVKKHTSKAEWLETALSVLEKEGADGVKIERLAKVLKTSRSGFYWHFQDRAELLGEMLEYWRREYTEVVFKRFVDTDMKPEETLYEAMKMIVEHKLNRLEIHMRAWSDNDPEVAKVLKKIYQQRLDFLKGLFSALGFTGCDLEMRAQLWLCYATHGSSMFDTYPCEKGEDPIKVRHTILTS
jgi:AcrR family transcriptional regulator